MVSVNLKSSSWKHLIWLVYVCLFVFAAPYLTLSVLGASDSLFRIFFVIGSIALLVVYRYSSGMRIRQSLNSGWALGLILAIFIGLGFLSFSIDSSASLGSIISDINITSLIWQGIVFGLVGGIMIATLPFIIVWRSLAGSNPGRPRRFLVMILAAGSIGIVTLCNNMGLYGISDINDRGGVQKNIIAGIPTLISGNPIAAPIAGAFKSVSEVVSTGGINKPNTPSKAEIANTPKADGGTN